MKKICVVYTTVATQATAEELAQGVIHENLAVCVNFSEIQSVYRWQGKIEQEAEWSMLFKTTVSQSDALLLWIKAHHPYELPSLWWRFVEASDEYASYLSAPQ